MTEDEAYEAFLKMRWPDTGGKPICPHCGAGRPYPIASRKKFKCRAQKCRKQFSATSGTAFASRKISFSDIMGGTDIVGLVDTSINEASKHLSIQWRTAKTLLRRICEISGLAVTRSQKSNPITEQYPYSATRSADAPLYIKRISLAVSRGIPDFIRADVCQEMAVDVVLGALKECDIEISAPRYIRKIYRFHDMRFETVSLNEVVPGTTIERIDTLTYEQDAW